MKRIRKACLGYEAWKSKHSPSWKPWLFPEQITLPRVKLEDMNKRVYSSELLEAEEENAEALSEGEIDFMLGDEED